MAKRTTTSTAHGQPNGSKISSQLELFAPGTLIPDRSKRSRLTKSPDTPSATSSLESASGALPSDKQVGQTTGRSGRGRARVSRSREQAGKKASKIQGTSGQLSIGSSASIALQSSLESKLQALMPTTGSTWYRMAWKKWTTPSGLSRSLLRAWPHPKSASVRTGWGTPRAGKNEGLGDELRAKDGRIEDMAAASYWPMRGDISIWSTAQTEDLGRLNPEHSRWLMGVPPLWSKCAPTEMDCASLPPEPSSKRSSKQPKPVPTQPPARAPRRRSALPQSTP